MLTPQNITIAVLLAVIIGGAAWYVIRAKRRGGKCIGCPHSKSCASRQNGCSSCCSGDNHQEK